MNVRRESTVSVVIVTWRGDDILYSFARNWGWWGRLVMLPSFCVAAFAKSPRNLLRALRRPAAKGATP